MGVKIGNIDIANEVVELHFQVLRTQLLLEAIIKKNNIQHLPSKAEMDVIEDRVIEVLNKKFPDMGIKKK
jgi:hypothetical protein